MSDILQEENSTYVAEIDTSVCLGLLDRTEEKWLE